MTFITKLNPVILLTWIGNLSLLYNTEIIFIVRTVTGLVFVMFSIQVA